MKWKKRLVLCTLVFFIQKHYPMLLLTSHDRNLVTWPYYLGICLLFWIAACLTSNWIFLSKIERKNICTYLESCGIPSLVCISFQTDLLTQIFINTFWIKNLNNWHVKIRVEKHSNGISYHPWLIVRLKKLNWKGIGHICCGYIGFRVLE